MARKLVWIDEKIHKSMKVLAAQLEKSITAVFEEAALEYLKRK